MKMGSVFVRVLLPGVVCLTLSCGGSPTGVSPSEDVPARHRPLAVMGRDYWTILYATFFSSPGHDAAVMATNAAPSVRKSLAKYDNPELRSLPAFHDAGLSVIGCQGFPDPEGKASTWRSVRQNFNPGYQNWKALELCLKDRTPLIVSFQSKRDRMALTGEVDLDYDDWKAWKARHPNLFFCRMLSEWDNDVGMMFWAFDRCVRSESRRAGVRAFIGEEPKNRRERVALQKKYFDRMVELYYGDRDLIGAMHAGVNMGAYAAAWGAKAITLETTNTSTPCEEFRWSVSGMFARGAARQFHIPWTWYVAIYMNGYDDKGVWSGNSVCGYPQDEDSWRSGPAYLTDKTRNCRAPYGGVSASLNRRAWYYAYLSGANGVEQEGWMTALVEWRPEDGKIHLSPRGKLFSEFHDFTKAHPDRGVAYAPVAVLVPFEQGYTALGGYSWGKPAYGYTDGDQAVDAVFFSLVPGFDRKSALLRGEEGNLHNTPFAMMYDVVVPDAPQPKDELLSVLKSYRAVIVAGDYPDRSFEKALAEYRASGGRVLTVDKTMLPPRDGNTVSDIQSGRMKFPAVEKMLAGLQGDYFPVVVSGDCLYGLNRTKTGWWLWAFNNKGVTKFTTSPEKIDASAASRIHVNLKALGVSSVTELLSGRSVPVKGKGFGWTIPAGDLAIFEIRTKGVR